MINNEKRECEKQQGRPKHIYGRVLHLRGMRLFTRFGLGPGKPGEHDGILTNEKGFIDTYLLTIYMIILITMLAVAAGIGVSIWRVANAEYQWFAEAVEFATRAANTNGDLQLVIENQNLAQQYYTVEMNNLMPPGSFTMDSFQALDAGAPVPHGTALGPGYLARITVQIPAVNVPLIGQQSIKIPMAYFGVAESKQLNN